MQTKVTREAALALLKKYNQESFHILHALTVEGVMRWYAQELGYGDEVDFWGLCGLLHDIEFALFQRDLRAGQTLDELIVQRQQQLALRDVTLHQAPQESTLPEGTLQFLTCREGKHPPCGRGCGQCRSEQGSGW